jgi:DNA gyrase inhibitor GyrI
MNTLDVRIVTLDPMRVASVLGFGPSPEMAAWQKLAAWAGPRGLLAEPNRPGIFGFNNPSPTPASPNYGYEFWIEVGPEAEAQASDEIRIKQFDGGLYAVTRCQGVETITETWKQLVAWLAASPYRQACHQWLEEHINVADAAPEELILDLYAPIAR